jgi:hypothetical protein
VEGERKRQHDGADREQRGQQRNAAGNEREHRDEAEHRKEAEGHLRHLHRCAAPACARRRRATSEEGHPSAPIAPITP